MRFFDKNGSCVTGIVQHWLLGLLTGILLLAAIATFNMDKIYGAEAQEFPPQGRCTNHFVSDIVFPVYTQDQTQLIQGYAFQQSRTDYHIVLPDSRNSTFFIKIPENYVGTDSSSDLYYQCSYLSLANKRVVTILPKPIQLKSEETYGNVKIMTVLKSLANFPLGEEQTLSIEVGTLDENKNFKESDIYNYHITRSLTLKTLEVSDSSDTEMPLSPACNGAKKPYELAYTSLCKSLDTTIKLNLEPTSKAADVYVGGEKLDAGKSELEINLQQYKNEQGDKAVIPISLKYSAEGKTDLETNYTLTISAEDHSPVIFEEPKDMKVDKGSEKPLTIAVEPDNAGSLTYQWYQVNGSGQATLIPDATDASYIPVQPYAGSYRYKCIVTNTVNNLIYETHSRIATVTVNKNKLTAPEFLLPLEIHSVDNKKEFYQYQKPEIDACVIQKTGFVPIEDVEYSFSVYKNDKNTFEGASKVENIIEQSVNTPTVSGKDAGRYRFVLPSQKEPGTYYYFVTVTVSEGNLSDTRISEPLCLTFKPVSIKLQGKGTTESPYLISNIEDLTYVKKMVEGTDATMGGVPVSFSGLTLALTSDITLPSDWKPIGNITPGHEKELQPGEDRVDDGELGIYLQPFCGILDGRDPETKEIHTLTVEDGGKPLLMYVRQATVKNLNLQGTCINGNGLVDGYTVDYGETGKYVNSSILLRTIDIENVTIKRGTKILKSGFIGGVASGVNAVNIRNCTVEENVEIGSDSTSQIGSFAGAFNGTVENSVSYATVHGKDYVGGLIGVKGQSMGDCDVTNSAFLGKVSAAGNCVGGIIGSGYLAADGTPVVQIHNCYAAADIAGKDKVGGILGTDEGHVSYNDTGDKYGVSGASSVTDTFFYGTLQSTGSRVGGIIGSLHDFTKTRGEASNFYLNTCGAKSGIGGTTDGTKVGEEKHNLAAKIEEFADGTITQKLNNSSTSYQNWEQGEKYPQISDKPVVTSLSIEGEYKTDYVIGDDLDLTGIKAFANWSNGDKTSVALEELQISGYDKTSRGVQTVTLKYKAVAKTLKVTVLKKEIAGSDNKIHVSFTLMGDTPHDSDKDGTVHTLSSGTLKTWVKGTYEIGLNDTVADLLEQVAADEKAKGNTLVFSNPTGNYVEAVTYKDKNAAEAITLRELQNGVNSGWMYTLNESHSSLGVGEQFLDEGNRIVFHYTDDYTKEEGTDKWGAPDDNQNGEENKVVANDVSSTVKDGQATSVVSDQSLTALIDQAIREKANQIQINVIGADKADQVSVAFTKDSAAQVADKAGASLQIITPAGIVTMDAKAIRAIVKAASGKDLILVLEKQAVRVLSAKKVSVKSVSASKSAVAEKKELGANALQTRVYLLSGDKEITDWGSSATIRVALPISSALKDKELSAALLGADDSLTKIGGKQTTIDKKSYYQVELSKAETIILDEEANIDDVITSQGKKGKPIVQDLTVEIKDGKGTVVLNEEDVNSLLEAATKYSAPSINLNLTETSGADALCLQVPKTALAGIASKAGVSLQMTTPQGIMLLDKESLKAIVKAAAGSEILFTVERQTLTADNKKVLGSNALQTKFTIGSGGKEVTDLGTAKAVLLLPLSDGLQGKTLAAATADAKGNLTNVTGKVIELDGESWYQIETTKAGVFLLAEKANLEAAIKAQKSTDQTAAFAKAKPAVKLTNISKTKIKASWKPVKGAGGYAVYRADKSKGKYVRIKVIKTAKTCAFTDSKLKAGKTYYYKVCAFKKAGTKTLYSAYSKACKMKATLAAPKSFKAKAGKGEVTLSWTKVKDADKYRIYRSSKKNGKYAKIGETSKVRFVDKKAGKGKTYYYKVCGCEKVKKATRLGAVSAAGPVKGK